ncbi:basic leucine zipper transcriptional factor ATF-like 3 isoform X1 [Bos taurus]|uniref:basic leucine zipper transcriptional factor ATF-like 3 isoform X1 n=1 Tax=Bos taurus TaxID=9913 RepID=UPI0028CB946A|nr:basic leucine zipper transcriptional factor ATF-like 3 isoform X1 [Bos taurus]
MGPGKKTPTPQTAHWSFSARVLRERPRDAPQGCAAPPRPQPVPASLLVGELRAPFWVRSHHVTSTKTGGPSGKLRQRALRMMTGRSGGGRKTELLLREVGRSRPRRLTNSTRSMSAWSKKTQCCGGRSAS